MVRDLLAGSANLSATLGEIRLGTVTANAGNLDVVATAGSVSGLANGSTNLAGGSTITAPGNITLTITGNAEIGVLDGAIVSGTSFDRLTVTTLRADAATLTAVNRLQVDSGTVTNAALFTTTGGLATNPSLIASPPIAGFGRADLSAQGLLSVSALSGAAQLGPIDSNAVGAAITVSAEAVDITSATTTNAGGNIALTATVGQLTVGTATSLGALTLDKLGLTGQITATGPLEAVNNLDIDSATDITATTLRSTLGDIILESTGDTDFTTALADAGSFTATTTLGSGGDLTADRIRAQGAVVIDADGAITLDGDPDVSAILGFTRSIQSAGGAVSLTSGADTSVFSVEAAGAVTVDAGTNLRFDSVTGTVVTLDAGDDMSGLTGAGAGPLPGFGRGDVSGSTITIGALGTTGIVQLGLLAATGAATVTADQIDIATIDAATIGLTSTLAGVALGEGDASGNITVVAATSALITDANSTGGDIAATANGGSVTLTTGAAAPLGGDITLLATGDVNGVTLTGGGVLDVTAGVDAVLTSAVMGGAIDVDAGANVRLGTLTGTVVTLDAGNDISGLVGVGAVSDPLPGFLRGDVNGTTITIGALGTTGIVQLDTLDASGAVTVNADRINISTIDAASIDLTSTLADVVLGEGDASGNITVVAATNALVTDANSTGGNIAVTANGGDVMLITGTAAPLGGDITLVATGNATGGTLAGGGVLDVTAGVDAVLTSAVMGGAIDVDAGANVRLGALTGTAVTLDAVNDISGLAGVGAVSDPLPAFLRGDVTGTSITIGGAGTTNVVQLDALTGTGAGAAITLSAEAVDVTSATSTAAGGNIALTATLGQLTLGTASSQGALTLDKLGATGGITANGSAAIGQ